MTTERGVDNPTAGAPPADLPPRPARTLPTERRRPTVFHHSAGAVVMIVGQCLLLARTDRDEWVFPKGHLEQGERAEDAAIREVREETGLEVEILASLGSTRYRFGRNGAHRKRVEWFLARPVGGTLALEPVFSRSTVADLEMALRLLTHRSDRQLAARAFAVAVTT